MAMTHDQILEEDGPLSIITKLAKLEVAALVVNVAAVPVEGRQSQPARPSNS